VFVCDTCSSTEIYQALCLCIDVQIHSGGIDLGKTTFHLVALGAASKVLVRKKFNRNQLLAYTANMPASLIGLEACAGAHFLGRALRKQGPPS
jgi:transposase